MAGGAEGIAVIDIHHLLGRQVVFDVVDEPVSPDLDFHRSSHQSLGDGTGFFIGHLVHILENVTEGELHNLHAITLTDELGVADDALQSKSGHAAVGEHEGAGVCHDFAHPEGVGDLVEVTQVHADIGLHTDRTAVGGEVDAFIAVLQDDDGLAVALQLGDAPVHAKEEIHLVEPLLDLGVDVAAHDETFVVTGIDGRQQLYLGCDLAQNVLRRFKSGGGGCTLCLRCHVLGVAGAARTFPEVGVGQTAHDGSDDEFLVHGFFSHADMDLGDDDFLMVVDIEPMTGGCDAAAREVIVAVVG